MTDRNDNKIEPKRLLAYALLLAAALCMLCIPLRMARLIDVGMRRGGVEYATPLRIRASTMDDLRLFLPEDTAREAKRAYELMDGVYVLHGTGEARRLSDRFALPVLEYLRTSEQGVNTFPAIRAELENGTLTVDDVRKQAQKAVKAMGSMPAAAQAEAATAFVRTEYAVSGGNPDTLRRSVITAELWHMTGLAAAALVLAGIALTLSKNDGALALRLILPQTLAAGAAVFGLFTNPMCGLVLLAEAAALTFALWKLDARTRRAAAFAAAAITCAVLPAAAASGVLALTLSPGKLAALLLWALLAAAPVMVLRSGKEARA